jgi:hypothetical protein
MDSIMKRKSDLDNLAKILENRGIIVQRPKILKKVIQF